MSIYLPEPRNNKESKVEKTSRMLAPWKNRKAKKVEKTFEQESCNTKENLNPSYYEDFRDVNNLNTNEYSSSTVINNNQSCEIISKKITKTKSIEKTYANGETQKATEIDEELTKRVRFGNYNDKPNSSFFGGGSLFDVDIFENIDVLTKNISDEISNVIDLDESQEFTQSNYRPELEEYNSMYLPENDYCVEDEDIRIMKQAMENAPYSVTDGVFIPNLEDMSIKCVPAKLVFTDEVLSSRKRLASCLSNIVFICSSNQLVPEIRKFKNYVGIGVPFDIEGYCFLNILKELDIPLNMIIERDDNSRYFDRYFMNKLMYNHNVVEINKQSDNVKKSNDDFGVIPFRK